MLLMLLKQQLLSHVRMLLLLLQLLLLRLLLLPQLLHRRLFAKRDERIANGVWTLAAHAEQIERQRTRRHVGKAHSDRCVSNGGMHY